MKKNNKGFSLVELIVVVLIMGIIAVALAPQVMKWVGTARTNADSNAEKDIKSAIQVAVADWQAAGGKFDTTGAYGSLVSNGKYLFAFDETGVQLFRSSTNSTIKLLGEKIDEVTGKDYTTKKNSGGNFTVTIDSKGVVTVY